MLTDKRSCVIEYYRIHIAFNICMLIYSVLVSAYTSWYKVSRAKGGVAWSFGLTKMLVDLVNVSLVALICDRGSKKVRYKTLFR